MTSSESIADPTTDESGGTASTSRSDRSSIPFGSRRRRTERAEARVADEQRVLVLTGLGHKNEQHYGPLAEVAGETTLVCLDPAYKIESATYVRVPDVGPRLLRIVLLFFLALYEGYRNEYDAVVSISLVPYGFYALALKLLCGYPAHLGIIGIDLDHHARQWYGAVPRWAFGQFDVVSVPGSAHAEALARYGVSERRIEILTNAIDTDRYRPREEHAEAEYDFVWIGRFSDEKDPVRFVESLAMLDDAGHEIRAVMVGDGPLRSTVRTTLDDYGLTDRVDLPGWVDDPADYYHRSRTFVLTSRRDALPLVLIEAMATRLAPIVPAVGSIPDVVDDGENGVVVGDRDPASFADAMERCLDDPENRRSIAAAATAVRSLFSMDQARADWRRILATMTAEGQPARPTAVSHADRTSG
ncbi:glycosyltransferase family 4 protein [Halosolutus halophilus]|uniref:glycosyltransferase family 4 protein n=1 Tax=Halosolutus halophilus TaxID=1552990 RepID=UPI0022351EB7|nr:glycosyltransferase family 4 protein [Halosolutus halophilus]